MQNLCQGIECSRWEHNNHEVCFTFISAVCLLLFVALLFKCLVYKYFRRHATRFHEEEWKIVQNSTTEEKFVPPNNFETEGFESSDDNEYHTSNIQGIDNQDMFEAKTC